MPRTNERPGARGGEQTGPDTTIKHTSKHIAPMAFRQRAKRVIVGMALQGRLPISSADSLLRILHIGGE